MSVGSSFSKRRFAQLAFIAIPLIIGGILFLFSRQMYFSQIRSVEQAWETNEIREYLSQIDADLDRMESNQREFYLTHEPVNLILFNFNRSEIEIRLGLLKYLSRGDPYLSRTLPGLKSLIEARMAELRQNIMTKEGEIAQNRVEPIVRLPGSNLDQSPKSLLKKMEERQSQKILKRRHAYEFKFETRETVSTLLLCLSAIAVIVSGIMLLRIRELQSIITICAWTQRVNFNGKWMRMEEFLWERFRVKVSHGISEEALKGVMGMVGKKLTVPGNRAEKPEKPPPPKAQPGA